MGNTGALLVISSFALSACLFFVLFFDFFLFEWFKRIISYQNAWGIFFSIWLLGAVAGIAGIIIYLCSTPSEGLELLICFFIIAVGLYSICGQQILRLKTLSRRPTS